MKTICIYHSRDLDGWMSAAIVKKWYLNPDNKQGQSVCDYNDPTRTINRMDMLGWDYGDDIPDLSDYDKVIMVDVAFSKDKETGKDYMIELYDRSGNDFTWIDHHISAIKENGIDLISGVQDTNFAACELTWGYFFPDEPMPEIVRLLGMYDSFRHKTKSFEITSDGCNKAKEYLKNVDKLKEFENNNTSIDGYSLVHYANSIAEKLSEEQKVLEFQYGARAYMSNYKECYKHLQCNTGELEMSEDVLEDDQILIMGSGIYKYLCAEAKQTYKKAFEIGFKNPDKHPKALKILKFLCVNQERFNPVNFGIDYHKDGYDGFACFWYKDGKWNWSLYNDNGEVDVSKIAKEHGGGGHEGAAGFVCNTETMLNIINQ